MKRLSFYLGCDTQSNSPEIGCTPETLRAWHQKHLDEQNPIKVQEISDQEKNEANGT